RRTVAVQVQQSGTKEPIELNVTGLPAGVAATFVPPSGGVGASQVQLAADAKAADGSWTVRLVARAGDLEDQKPFRITVRGPEPEITNSLEMKFRLIPAGKFLMGSPATEKGRLDDEDQHEVELSRPYYLGVHEVTVGEFQKFVKAEKYRTD